MTKSNLLLAYSDPKTEEQIYTNIAYLLRESEYLRSFDFLTWDGYIKVQSDVRYDFIMQIMPEINKLVRRMWAEYEVVNTIPEIHRLKKKLSEL